LNFTDSFLTFWENYTTRQHLQSCQSLKTWKDVYKERRRHEEMTQNTYPERLQWVNADSTCAEVSREYCSKALVSQALAMTTTHREDRLTQVYVYIHFLS
jgi:hypothetical protein